MKNKFLLPLMILISITSCSTSGTSILNYSNSSGQSGASSFSSNSVIYKGFMLNNPEKEFNQTETTKSGANYVSSLQSLGKDLYHKVFDGDNKVFSPISIATCFSMLLEGAKEESKAELEAFLHYNDSFNHLNEIQNMLLRNSINDEKNETYLDICQSFWADDSFKNDLKKNYVDKLTDYYYAEAFSGKLDSDQMHAALADYINDKTHNFLNVKKDDFADYAGVLWLLNTIYLKSQWQDPFNEMSNKKDAFINLSGGEKEVTYMNDTHRSAYLKKDDYVISSLFLKQGLRFNILLPNKGSNYSSILDSEQAINDLYSYVPYSSSNSVSAEIHYQIPQFKIQKSIDLKELLQSMGLSYIFDPELANLRDIAELKSNENLFVSKAKHEAGIEVKNEGLEAAAYTIIEVEQATSIQNPPVPIDFIVDHPFAYSVVNQDNIPLFTGVVTTL